jgi:hypothetical protein
MLTAIRSGGTSLGSSTKLLAQYNVEQSLAATKGNLSQPLLRDSSG